MRDRARLLLSLAAGLAVYVGMVVFLYGFHRYASVPGSAWVPAWYTGGELLVKAAMAVAPGFVAGWICRNRGAVPGAVVGAVGGFLDVVMTSALTGIPFRAFGTRIILSAVCTAAAGAVTNAAGGIAGKAFRHAPGDSGQDSGPSSFKDPAPEPSRRRRRRTRLYAS